MLLEENIKEVTERLERRRKQLQNDIQKTRGYWQLKDKH
jgi:hypothetical protein